METSPKEQRGRPGQSASGVLPDLADRPTGRLPFRPVGAPMRCPAPTSPLQAAPPAVSLGQRLEHLATAAFINPNFAWLWWGQAISSVGDYAWDTALVLWVASYLVAGQSWAPLAVSGVVLVAALPHIVADPLVFGRGVVWALVLNALSFVVVFLAPLAIQAPPSAHSLAPGETGHFSREFLDGVGYVAGHVVLRTILVAEVLTWLGFGALQSLGYFFITENLHAPASDYGLLGADFGVGAVVGAVLVAACGERCRLARLLWIALVTSGLFVIVMSHLTSLYPALGAAFLFGVSTTAVLVTAGPLTLDSTSREFVGRGTAVINPLRQVAALISGALAGGPVGT